MECGGGGGGVQRLFYKAGSPAGRRERKDTGTEEKGTGRSGGTCCCGGGPGKPEVNDEHSPNVDKEENAKKAGEEHQGEDFAGHRLYDIRGAVPCRWPQHLIRSEVHCCIPAAKTFIAHCKLPGRYKQFHKLPQSVLIRPLVAQLGIDWPGNQCPAKTIHVFLHLSFQDIQTLSPHLSSTLWPTGAHRCLPHSEFL